MSRLRRLRASEAMAMRILGLFLAGAVSVAAAPASADYGYPIVNRYSATVIGTPPALRAPVPDKINLEVRSIQLFERDVPRVFWNGQKFFYSTALQKQSAPLLFLIAGTGARFDSSKMAYLQKAFHQAGFSVVNISSPTQADFITTGSSSSVPGLMEADVEDLYSAMQAIYKDLKDEVQVSEFYLAGYSLGGTQSAFVGHRDAQIGAFGFKKVLMINPAWSLYNSVNRLDEMLARNIPGGVPQLQALIDDLYRRVSRYLHEHDREPLDAEVLYKAALANPLTDQEKESLIAVSFRISAATMLFTSDVMRKTGLVVPKDQKLTLGTSLTPYMKRAARWTFTNYMDEQLLPYWQARRPGLTREEAIRGDSLESIRDWLGSADHVAMMTNADDIILAPGEVDLFRETFGERATIYPVGGHCGNIMFKENVDHMISFFGGEIR